MTSKFRLIPVLLAMAAAPIVGAQTLEQEITVDHDVVPEHRDVTRRYFTPSTTLPTIKAKRMSYNTSGVSIRVPGSIPTLDPAAYADTIPTASWRGYAGLGYLPTYNLGAVAGYKFIDNDCTRLTGYMQYNGTSYKKRFPFENSDKATFDTHTGLIGLTIHQAVGNKSFLDAGIDGIFSRYDMPSAEITSPQNMRNIDLSVAWSSSTPKFVYRASADISHFGYSNSINIGYPVASTSSTELFEPVNENAFKLNGFIRTDIDTYSSIGLDVDFSVLRNNRRTDAAFSDSQQRYIFSDYGSYSHALAGFQPYYRFRSGDFNINLGAQVDFSINSGKTLHIAPAISAAWKPGAVFTAFVKAEGGEHQNTLRSLYNVSPYIAPMMAYENSNIPYDFNAGFTIGTWQGMYAEVSGGYTRANDWLMPVYDNNLTLASAVKSTIFKPFDLKGFHWRIAAGYDYRGIAKLDLTYEGAQQDYNKGYYLWRDRAKSIVTADLRVTPISPLDINIGYTLRTGRKVIDFSRSADPAISSYNFTQSLGCMRDLRAGALYRIDSQWSAFINVTNLLNSKYSLIGGVPAQGISGLVGATYKF